MSSITMITLRHILQGSSVETINKDKSKARNLSGLENQAATPGSGVRPLSSLI